MLHRGADLGADADAGALVAAANPPVPGAAAGELGSGVYFHPVAPEDAAAALRAAI